MLLPCNSLFFVCLFVCFFFAGEEPGYEGSRYICTSRIEVYTSLLNVCLRVMGKLFKICGGIFHEYAFIGIFSIRQWIHTYNEFQFDLNVTNSEGFWELSLANWIWILHIPQRNCANCIMWVMLRFKNERTHSNEFSLENQFLCKLLEHYNKCYALRWL